MSEFKALTVSRISEELEARGIKLSMEGSIVVIPVGSGGVRLNVIDTPVSLFRGGSDKRVCAETRPYGLKRAQTWNANSDDVANVKLIVAYVLSAIQLITQNDERLRVSRAGYEANIADEARLSKLLGADSLASVDASPTPGLFDFRINLRRELSAAQVEALVPLVRSIQEIIK